MKRNSTAAVWTLAVVAITTACGSLGNLRRDIDEEDPYAQPTVGGAWTERGLLEDPSGRTPASGGPGRDPGGRSWVGADDDMSNGRDRYRKWNDEEDPDAAEEAAELGPSYSRNPALPPGVNRLYKNGTRATRSDFLDESQNEGSLWASDGQTNYYFTKNKIRGVGDIVTVNIEADFLKDSNSEIARTLSPNERELELESAQERLAMKAMGIGPDGKEAKDSVTSSAAAPARGPAGAGEKSKSAAKVDIPKATNADIDVSKNMDLKAGDTMMAEIAERYPNGNYKIRGTKRVRYRNGFRILNMVGVVRGSDIGEDDVVPSGKLYEYRLEALR